MVFAHDTETSLSAAVTLVNTDGVVDELEGIEELDAFYAAYEYTGRHDGDRAELDAVRALRPRLRRLFTSERDDVVALVNEMLAEARALPSWSGTTTGTGTCTRSTRRRPWSPGSRWRRRWRWSTWSAPTSCPGSACAPTPTATGSCWTSPATAPSRFCSTGCGNRNAVAAYRARRAGTPA